MVNYAVVDLATGVVDGVVVWDGNESSGWSPPEGTIAVESDSAQPGWSYADGVFTAPPQIRLSQQLPQKTLVPTRCSKLVA